MIIKEELIDELIADLSLLSNSGLPDLKSEKSISYISEFFNERGMWKIGQMIIENLFEDDKEFKNPDLNKIIRYKSVNGEDVEGKVGNLLRRPKEEDAYIQAIKALGGEDSDGYKKAMDDLGAEGQPKRDIEKEREDGEEESGEVGDEKPQTPSAFDPQTKGGKDYLENLPVGDPARQNPIVYPIGGGYYSDTPDGEPMYKMLDEINEDVITVDTGRKNDVKMQVLGDKEREEVSTTQKTPTKKIISGEPNQKNKKLNPNVNTSDTDTFTSTDTGISDTDYKNQKEVNLINPNIDYTDDINNIIEGSGIPSKYGKVLARLLNTQNKNQISILNIMSGAGAGQISSQAGEIVTMIGIGLDDDKANQLFAKLDEIISSQSKGDYPIISKEWVESAKLVREITKKRYDNEFGVNNWKIDNVAWDVKDEFEALGNDDYQTNKGFSSDMYVKINSNGKVILDEISLKKDSQAMLFSGSVTDIKKWFGGQIPPAADFEIYKEGELNRPIEYAKNISEEEYTSTFSKSDEDIIESMVKSKGDIRKTLVNTGILSINKKTNKMEITPSGKAYIKDFRSLTVPPPIDSERFKETFGTGAVDRFKKGMIIHAAILANEGSENAYNFLNKQLGYVMDDDGNYPEGSIKRYQNDTIKALVESDAAKNALLQALQEKLPMKALIDGEEKMAIGGLSADSATLKNLMNIDSFEDFKGGLAMEEDADGNNYLVYKSLGPPAKEVKISEVKVRQKGQGYASSVGLEFVIASDFAIQLYQSNIDIYGSVELSKKERLRLKV